MNIPASDEASSPNFSSYLVEKFILGIGVTSWIAGFFFLTILRFFPTAEEVFIKGKQTFLNAEWVPDLIGNENESKNEVFVLYIHIIHIMYMFTFYNGIVKFLETFGWVKKGILTPVSLMY